MAYRDLREWITQVNELGELKTVEGADWDLEIGAIIEMARKESQIAPCLLFDSIKGLRQGFEIGGGPAQFHQASRAHLRYADGHGDHGSGRRHAQENQRDETDSAARGQRRTFHGERLGRKRCRRSAFSDAAL